VRGAVLALMAAAVAAGVLLGLCVAQACRAWRDDAAEDARRRFHALYADPAMDIDDLPAELPMCAICAIMQYRNVVAKDQHVVHHLAGCVLNLMICLLDCCQRRLLGVK
jgi:hypothetical protein